MTPDQKKHVAALLENYDKSMESRKDNSPEIGIAILANFGDLALRTLRVMLKEETNDPRAGRRIAPVEVYTILNKALKEDRLIDRLSPLSTAIANLSRLEVPDQPTKPLDPAAEFARKAMDALTDTVMKETTVSEERDYSDPRWDYPA